MFSIQENPFRLDFGAKPKLYVSRIHEQSKIIDTFSSEEPSAHIFMLIGARGTGKTVLMTAISHQLRSTDQWLHIDLNSEEDLMIPLAAGLEQHLKGKMPKLSIGFSVKGLDISVENKGENYRDIRLDLDKMLEVVKKEKKRLLITIDEVSNSRTMRDFTNYFQHCLREDYPVFVIMTGLYKNIRALQNNRSQTFLRRVPKIVLESLNISRIAQKYGEVFDCSQEDAMSIAQLTAGYSYGFQILGYLIFDAGKRYPDESILSEYRINLEENAYEKIWEELSENERKVAAAIASAEPNSSVKDIRESIGMDSNNFSTYKDVLQKSGLLSCRTSYGRINFSLPFFKEYVKQVQAENF